jgi:hypothetical protein
VERTCVAREAIFYPGVSSVWGAIFSTHYPPLMKCICRLTKSSTYPSLTLITCYTKCLKISSYGFTKQSTDDHWDDNPIHNISTAARGTSHSSPVANSEEIKEILFSFYLCLDINQGASWSGPETPMSSLQAHFEYNSHSFEGKVQRATFGANGKEITRERLELQTITSPVDKRIFWRNVYRGMSNRLYSH